MNDLIERYKYSILGAAIGFIVALLFFTLGFFKSIALIILMVLGAFTAHYIEKKGIIGKIQKKI
ncbi:DUF2273 domain-containing protein [Enterococcus faecalis]|uniref:DUF2273 domain-containing protein n=1 Tax=Enterococcus TaxID=1350 RepID=UPI001A96FA47|nr:DUF2273 domain-containing protein [Enterococcus faecalis]